VIGHETGECFDLDLRCPGQVRLPREQDGAGRDLGAGLIALAGDAGDLLSEPRAFTVHRTLSIIRHASPTASAEPSWLPNAIPWSGQGFGLVDRFRPTESDRPDLGI
jgi:hypothetical protein